MYPPESCLRMTIFPGPRTSPWLPEHFDARRCAASRCIQSALDAFAAIRADGGVVTWGDPKLGGCVQQLKGVRRLGGPLREKLFGNPPTSQAQVRPSSIWTKTEGEWKLLTKPQPPARCFGAMPERPSHEDSGIPHPRSCPGPKVLVFPMCQSF